MSIAALLKETKTTIQLPLCFQKSREAPYSVICIQNTTHFEVFVVVGETRKTNEFAVLRVRGLIQWIIVHKSFVISSPLGL